MLQELRYVHEELIKQKTAFQSRLQDRDSEISRLRNQVTASFVHISAMLSLLHVLMNCCEICFAWLRTDPCWMMKLS